ncbi:MAG: hypothetical protein AAF215_29090 [Cyanobacteria bacterium P01_A01_bin.123]
MAQPKDNKAVISLAPEPVNTAKAVETALTSTMNDQTIDDQTIDDQTIDDTFAALKTLLSTVEKLQKARQSVGDIKPLLIRLLDGEMVSGEELEQLKTGINGLGKLVKFYGDYQDALAKAQPARELLDGMLKA